ncbi:MAG: type II toxin-antitoxin system HicA family toxin [Magnetococcales bacterium]|nr:type II toxin-antitoxin system HicA family toxin [Magnetococcales bacterium]
MSREGVIPKSSREIIKILKEAGWIKSGQSGGHHHFRHPEWPGKDMPIGTLKSIERQTGLKLK